MAWFSNLKIVGRIGLGFAGVLGLLTGLALVTILELREIRVEFGEYDALASDAEMIAELEKDLIYLELHVREYVLAPTDAARAEVAAIQERFGTVLQRARAEIGKPERARLVADIVQREQRYSEGFRTLSSLMAERERLVSETLNQVGPRIRAALSEIMRTASRDGDLASANDAAQAQEHLLLGRLYVSKFLDADDQEALARARDELALAKAAVARLGAGLENPERRALQAQAASDLPVYARIADETGGVIARRNAAAQALMETGAAIHADIKAIRDSVAADRTKLRDEAQTGAENAQALTMMAALGALVIGALLAWRISGSIAGPIRAMTAAMGRLASGDIGTDVPGLARADEVGAMAKAVQVFKENAIERARLEESQAAERAEKERRVAAIERLIESFEAQVTAALADVSGAAEQLGVTARSMAALARDTSDQAGASASAAQHTSGNVQTVASATEEMAASIREIARQVERSTAIAAQAVTEAESTTTAVRGLSDAANRIGEVIELIQNIAAQTNLLALNATIEAARAGDAGKGFAVVANEVKTLATQTARATEDIASQISGVQTATQGTVQAIQSIGRTIVSVNEISAAIAAAIAEQDATTGEITRNVQEAAVGTESVSHTIVQVNAAAGETGAAASQVLSAAEAVAGRARTMRGEVQRFLAGIRAA